MNIQTYIDKLNTRYKSGIATEHSFRGDLQTLLETLLPDVLTTNEPTRIKCGAPDYILTKNDIPLGYIEAKDMAADLNSKAYQEQFNRYKKALGNLIITNYIDFQVFKEGVLVASFSLATLAGNKIVSKPEQFDAFTAQIKDFATPTGQTIKSASKLAGMMAVKSKLLADVIAIALVSDEKTQQNSSLKQQLQAFKDVLIHDIKAKEFADIYAQTIAYGMFAARLHDHSLPTFSRQEAATLIPKTNPFLRSLFQYIAGYDLDTRIIWIVDALADIFRATDVKAILKNFGKSTQQTDPIIHFYETFLSEYDPKLRKARGVWYTPEPVVRFIVRAVDDILKTEFEIKDGLASTEKTDIQISLQETDLRTNDNIKKGTIKVHKVQILDPATGTGTFLAEVIKHIYNDKFEGQQGTWSNYVENHLIPRINGFELLMASYAMAHLKLELLLSETGYKPKKEQRLKIFLTNSLEEYHPYIGELPFAGAISDEANQANYVKKETPVMVIVGNPPYFGESKNKGEWIMHLMNDYKKEPGGKEKLKERNPKWLNDDYVKFLRYGQYFIEKNGSGILAFINPHGFLDNPTFRGMRWNLLKTYDKIYTLDLHGNSNKKEVSPDGSPDVNVFDIEQGVSINLFIKTGKKKANELGKVFHHELYGKREGKYNYLNDNLLKDIPYVELKNIAPQYYFVQKDFSTQKEYYKGFQLTELFTKTSVGIVTGNDPILVNHSKEQLIANVERNYSLDSNIKHIQKICYRPFDDRFIYFDNSLVERARMKVTQHFLIDRNEGLVFRRQQPEAIDLYIFCSNGIIADGYIRSDNKGSETIAPLYLYSNEITLLSEDNSINRIPNFNSVIIEKIANSANLKFSNEKESRNNTFAPVDILDYIYAVLHSPAYREKYKEFLKIDFPRVPYPKDRATFWALVQLGGEIRQLHLLEAPTVSKYITKYDIDGNDIVEKPVYKDGNVYINDTQYFQHVPQIAWEFYIGGYQPAQKWLKDRKERTLTFEDIQHYQKIIVSLTETARLMMEIDKIDFM